MSQERISQSLPPQALDNERLQALQNLQRNINPFQEGREGEIARAHGLANFYLQMADPSVDYLETVSAGLAGLPFDQIRQIQFSTYDAGENPRGFFARSGIEVDDVDRLQAGIGNSFEVIDNLMHRFDYETGEVRWDEDLDHRTLAESAHERIQVQNGERQIRKAVERVRNEPNLRKRYRMGLDLRRQVLGYISSHDFTFQRRHGDEDVEPTWNNLSGISGLSTEVRYSHGGSSSGYFGLSEAVDVAHAAITRYPFEKKLEQLPARDRERFDQLRLQYGAKAANLMLLSELVPQINKLRRGWFDVEIAVPDFQVISVDSYRIWREGKLIDGDLQPYFDWASALQDDDRWHSDEPAPADYIVRSSAVFSEDGESVTGAGVYDSVRLHGGATFEEFKDAVAQVYTSTESPKAQGYRAQNGIDGEEMGLIIQKFVAPRSFSLHGQSHEGYINSKLAGVPQLMELVTGTSRNFVNREALDFFLALDANRKEEAFRGVHHFQPDQFKVTPSLPIRVAQITAAVERIWGRDIQAEFVSEGSTVNFVQVRELPTNAASQVIEVEFPNEQAIHSGSSIGVGDLELPMLDDRNDNSERVGVTVLMGNDMWTMDNFNPYRLPKEGAVIIYNDNGRNGHIQTLCAERGLVCIFPDVNEDRTTLRYHDLANLGRVRIVSNGIEARVYDRQDQARY